MPRMSKYEDAGKVERYLSRVVFVCFVVFRGSSSQNLNKRSTNHTNHTNDKEWPISLLFSVGGFLEFFDVELLHFHHRLHHPLCFLFVSTLKYLENNIRNDLPEKAELVL